MLRVFRFAVFVVIVLVAGSMPATPQQAADTATLNATFSGLARMTFSASSVTFPDADPDLVPYVPASQGPITITAKARTSPNGTVTLTVRAADELRSGLDTIPASNITWTASGPGFTNGTLSTAASQLVASWTDSGVRSGTQTFSLRNLWTYPTGIYTLTMTFTLTAA
jgi:hypothetical protein